MVCSIYRLYTLLFLILYLQVVEVLIRSGADLNVAGSVGDRPLHLACGKGYLRVTQLLIEGSEINKAEGMASFFYCFKKLCLPFFHLEEQIT